MKKTILSILLASAIFCVNGQEIPKENVPAGDTSKIQPPTVPVTPDQNVIFTMVEQMPEFKGGEKALSDFLSSNLRYPNAALKANIQGRVIVRFAIGADGRVSDDVTILKGIGGGCDEEVVRLIKKMPRWIPGKQGGKPVIVWYTLPIVFEIPK